MENMQKEIVRLTSQVTGLRSVVRGQNTENRQRNASPARHYNRNRYSPYRPAQRRSITPMPRYTRRT
ncbi:Hypothetical predicted protein [Mytilus galloprovincialis]|nr:Hypothetical predicted protein [Mytilus galloprovincialis]